jgi:hypothetical protein
MSKAKSANHAGNWLQKWVSSKDEMKRMKQEVGKLRSEEIKAKYERDEAKGQFNAFTFAERESESTVPAQKKGELSRLKRIYEDAKERADIAISKHKERYEKKEALEKELIEMKKNIIDIDNVGLSHEFNAKGLEVFVMEMATPFFEPIRKKNNRLNNLLSKRDELKVESESLKIHPKKFDENNLLQISVSEHTAAIEKDKKMENRQEAINDLLGKLSSEINRLGGQIKEEQISFTNLLVDAVKAYTDKARTGFVIYLESIIEKNIEYAQSVRKLAENLEAEANKGIERIALIERITLIDRFLSKNEICLIQDTSLLENIGKTINQARLNLQ